MRHFDFARDLRQNPTKAQQTLWYHLRKRNIHGLKFRREYPLGVYIVDFVCLEKKLIIEIDGGQHAIQTQYDQRRTTWLAAQGFNVVRFWNNEVIRNTETVLGVLFDLLKG